MRSKRFHLVILLLLGISFYSCKLFDDEVSETPISICGFEKPLNDISWLNQEYLLLKEQPEFNGIVAFRYNEMTVIEIQQAIMSSTNNSQYKCDGTKIDFLTNIDDYNHYLESRHEIAILFGTRIWQ